MNVNVYSLVGLKEKIPGILSPLSIACSHWDVDIAKVKSKSRKREYVRVRQIIMWYYYTYVKGYTYQRAADIFGLGHDTAMHAIKTINNLRETDKEFNKQVEQFLNYNYEDRN